MTDESDATESDAADARPSSVLGGDAALDGDAGRSWLGLRSVVALLGAVALGALLWHDRTRGVDVFLEWSPSELTWLYRLAIVLAAVVALPPLLRHPGRVRRIWDRMTDRRLSALAATYVAGFGAVGLVGPILLGRPRVAPRAGYQPPLFGEVRFGQIATSCAGPIRQEEAARYCLGSLQYPLGTSATGKGMIELLVAGAHVSLQVAVVSLAIIVPLATVVGVVAGYYGGRVDRVLMRYVDVQATIPAIAVYVVATFLFGSSLLLLIAVFGLFNWGDVARLVRSETRRRSEDAFVDAAAVAGMSDLTVVRRHLLPNVSNTVVTGATQKLPKLILLEAGLTYIELGDVGRYFPSFGGTIRAGFQGAYGQSPLEVWWIWVLPGVGLSLTAAAVAVVGDALRDALDPRTE